jgi:hypothetical protein
MLQILSTIKGLEVKATLVVFMGFLWATYKKEILDWTKELLKKIFDGLRALLLWLLRLLLKEPVARRVTDSEFKDALALGFEEIEILLYLLMKEYEVDRVTVFWYEEQKDGSALASCVVEAKQGEIPSMRNMQQQAIPLPLWYEIKRISAMPGRKRYVPDAQIEESAAMRAALRKYGVATAYYEMMYDPTGEYKCCHLLALSWHSEKILTELHLKAFHNSAIAAFAILKVTDHLKGTSTDSPI